MSVHQNPLRTASLSLLLSAALLTACGSSCSGNSSAQKSPVAGPQDGLTAIRTFPLSRATHGLDGRLELLVDTRLTEALRDSLWGTGQTDPSMSHLGDADEDAGLPVPKDLRPAVLQVVDSTGAVRERQLLERPLARFEPELLTAPGVSFWLLTVDYTAPAGSYNGLVTLPLAVQAAGFRPLEAVDEKGARAPVRLMRSLKSDWRLEPARASQGQSILYVSTRPDLDHPGGFLVSYARLAFDGQRWVWHARQEPGFWESDGEFPTQELFP